MEATSAGEAPAKTPTSTMLSGIVIIAGAIVFLWFAPSAYTVYKALHVVAILVWVGGDVTLTTLGIVFERRRDAGALAELGKMGAWIGTRVYTPALFAAFAFGVAMIERAGWGGARSGSTSRSPAGPSPCSSASASSARSSAASIRRRRSSGRSRPRSRSA
jgi:hypothetical protein